QRRSASFAGGGAFAQDDRVSARECRQRSLGDGHSQEGASRAVHSWTCFRARRGIHSETGPVPVNLTSLPQSVRLAVEAAQNKKAAGIVVIDLSGLGAFTEYFVICTGFSSPQVQAICTEVEEQLWKHRKREPEHREGHRSADWALLDFGGFIVHV